jgi:signal transduction histidine kinase
VTTEGRADPVRPAPRIWRTSTFQFAAMYLAIFAISVLLLLGLIYWATAGYVARQTDETIEIEIAGLDEQYRQRGLNGLARVIRERLRADPEGSAIYLFAGPDYSPLAGNLDAWPDLVADSNGWLNFTRTNAEGGKVPARARLFVFRDGLHLLVGRDIRELVRIEAIIRRGLLWGLSLSIALGLLGGLLMSRRINSRLEVINRASREIMAGDLSRRIPERGTGDEFDRLSGQLNAMLERIEELMQGVRHVTDNVAHDLRTPLTRLRARLEVLRTEAGAASADLDVDACIQEADHLLQTFSALLRIARIEAGGQRRRRDPIALDRLVIDAIDVYQALAEDRDLTLTAQAQPCATRGDRDLLFQALMNLIDNAIKYTPSGGRVTVISRADANESVLEVRDTGPGIPEGDRKRVTERFFRGDGARGATGNGLGLSLVAAVAERHDARLEFADAEPGLIVRLRLPAAEVAE